MGSENGTARLLFVVVFEREQGDRSTEITDFCANVIAHWRLHTGVFRKVDDSGVRRYEGIFGCFCKRLCLC